MEDLCDEMSALLFKPSASTAGHLSQPPAPAKPKDNNSGSGANNVVEAPNASLAAGMAHIPAYQQLDAHGILTPFFCKAHC